MRDSIRKSDDGGKDFFAEEKNRITTVKLSKKTKERLDKLKLYGRESYEEIVQRILDILNLCRASPERAQRRLILFERQIRRKIDKN